MTNPSGTHPDLEHLAAFVDGRLAGAERTRLVEHLAECEDCLDLVAETGNLQEDLQDELEEEPTSGAEVVTHPRAWKRWGPAVLTVAAVLTLVVGAWRTDWLLGPSLGVETLADRLEGSAARLEPGAWTDHGWGTFRGEELTREQEQASFRAGVLAVDLQVLLRTGQRERAAEVAEDLRKQIRELPSVGPLGASYDELAQGLWEGEPLPALAQEATRADEYLKGLIDEIYYELGKWAEAGRLAARGGDREALRSRSIRGAVEEFSRAGLGEEVGTRLLEIQHRLDGPLDAEELALLAKDFRSLVAGDGVRVVDPGAK